MNSELERLEQFNVAHPNQRVIPAADKRPDEIIIELEEEESKLVKLLAALPDAIALEMIQTLAGNRNDYTLAGIAQRLNMSRTTLYRHIKDAKCSKPNHEGTPLLGSSQTDEGRLSTRRGRAYRATNATKPKNKKQNEITNE